VWVTQRLWLGTLSLVAVLGARWLFTVLGVRRIGAIAGALVYLLTPYQLPFTARLSVLLLPWAALPWLVGLTARATRTRDWRAPAAMALVLFLAGGVNASSLVLVGIAPVLWVVTEVLQGRFRPALAGAARVGLLALGVSAFWIVGLRLQGAYGLPVLQLTESLPEVARASAPGELLRGLGNWFFYLRDGDAYNITQARAYAHEPFVVAVSLALPILGLLAAVFVRWRHRGYLVSLVVVGTVVGAGAWSSGEPSTYASFWERLSERSSIGLALRNSPRVVPIIVLGLAGLLAAAVSALPRPSWRPIGAGLVAVVALGAFLPVWQDGYPGDDIDRPEDLPEAWTDAAAALDDGDHDTRVLQLPGAPFEFAEWGATLDPLLPTLTDRPIALRQVLPAGSPASVNLLDALDRRAQLGTLEDRAIAPMTRLLGLGTVLVRGDVAIGDRYQRADPSYVEAVLDDAVGHGLDDPIRSGPTVDGASSISRYDVTEPVAILHTAPGGGPVILAGDGDGIVDAASAGLLDGGHVVRYSGSLSDEGLTDALDEGARLVVTDSNRRRIQTWFTSLRDTRGPTEAVGETQPDPSGYDYRLELFPGTGDDARTVVEQMGGTVTATEAGGPRHPEDRAANAVDDDPDTSWRVDGRAVGATLTIRADEPIGASSVTLLQPATPDGRRITSVRVQVDDDTPFSVELDESSWTGSGQVVPLPDGGGDVLRVTITGVDPVVVTPGVDGRVGFVEIGWGDLVVTEVVRPPVDLLARVGAAAAEHPIDIVLTRLRSGLAPSIRADEEARLVRAIELPVARRFDLRGTLAQQVPVADGGCRDDLVQVDGRGVPVQVEEDGRAFEACDPLALSAGRHLLTTPADEPGPVDRVVLSTVGSPRAEGASPDLQVVERTATSAHVRLDPSADPYWLVLGESDSEGWAAHVVEGSATIEDRQLVDGYANGWRVTPTGDGPVEIELRWEPQRTEWVALAVSAGTVVVALLLLWRRRGRPADPDPLLVDEPRWRSSGLAAPGSWAWRLGIVAGVAIGTTVVAEPVIGVVAGVLTLLAVAVPVLALPIALIAPLSLALTRPLDRPNLAWLAIALLAAHAAWTHRQDGSNTTRSIGS
jgi:arabinofuranan 3-O-arabinosyltransferase